MVDFSRSKTAILSILEALNLDLLEISHLKMSKIAQKFKCRTAKMIKIAVFDPLKSAKIDFTYNQSGRKMVKKVVFDPLKSAKIDFT